MAGEAVSEAASEVVAGVVGRREREGPTGRGELEGVGVHGDDAYMLKVRAVSSLCILRPRPPGRPLAAE